MDSENEATGNASVCVSECALINHDSGVGAWQCTSKASYAAGLIPTNNHIVCHIPIIMPQAWCRATPASCLNSLSFTLTPRLYARGQKHI
jgi:hypothetical protein